MLRVRLKVKDLLHKRGLTQVQLSELTGIRQAAISEMSRDIRENVSLRHLEKIANALNITDIREIIDIVDE
jgi:transcriptional regulator with XRE-family HTH domain